MLFLLLLLSHILYLQQHIIFFELDMNKKQAKIFEKLLKPLFMAFTMSFVMLLINVGLFNGFLSKWMKGFTIGYIVAVPTSLLAAKITDKIIIRLNTKNSSKQRT